MSQYNPPDPTGQSGNYGLPYAQGAYSFPPPRPTSVTVIAIFAIILGALGLCGVIFQFIQLGAGKAMNFGQPNPVMDMLHDDPVLRTWTLATTVVGMVAGLLALAGGIGSLSLKPWARTSLLVYAVVVIAMGLVGLVMNFAVILPKMNQIPQNRPEVQMAIKIMPISAVGGFVFSMILPVCVLIFMTRPHVKAAFAGRHLDAGGPPPPGGYPPGGGGAYPPPGGYAQ